MNKLFTIVALSLLVSLACSQTSSSANWGCKGSDATCISTLGDTACCLYTFTKFKGVISAEYYACGYNPSKLSLLSKAYSAAQSVYSDIKTNTDYEYGTYCANSVVIKIAAALSFAGLASLLA